ncbi:Exocyst complex component 5 [Eumeta japonica]|uniref:Exocyst complex component 5 n=1 Tax=Eumeta variegata TaxID=151549 RepID=A0A4C1WD19_EUMVA|nr:Exocyst complex component 5 [Eumeta japonica]
MMNQYLKELEQDPFDPDEFVERMVRRSMQETGKENHFDPDMIHDIFTQAIQDLRILQERQERKCSRLEQAVQGEEKLYANKLAEIMEQHMHCVNVFSSLDERMSRCGGRALDVGDKLGAARAPRARAAAARDLLSYLTQFMSPGPVLNDLFNDSNRLNEAADVIQKLYTISQELPPDKFEVAKKKIEAKYDEIERNLIEEFVKAQNNANMDKMKEIANIMTNFKSYSQCVDAYIETSQMTALMPVERRFIYLRQRALGRRDRCDKGGGRPAVEWGTQRVCDELVAAGLVSAEGGTSSGTLRREALVNGALTNANDGYPVLETRRLRAILSSVLNGYYADKQHVKKQIQGGGFQELRRDLQAVIGARANINIAQIENYGGETFLSEDLMTRMLADAKTSFHRCKTLSNANELPNTATALLEVVVQQLLVEHVDYALVLGLQSIPIAESKSPPQIYFFDIVKQANAIINIFENFFQESVLPCVSSTPRQNDCLQKKSLVLEQIENKLDAGLERALNAVVSWVRLHLHTEQKKSDFKPEGDVDTVASPACLAVVSYLNTVVDSVHRGLDGDNRNAVALELAVRLHRVIYEHLQNFQFNSAGAMIAICDVKEYRSAVCGRGGRSAPPPAHALFDALHALCNLLLVKPENLHQVCTGETLLVRVPVAHSLHPPQLSSLSPNAFHLHQPTPYYIRYPVANPYSYPRGRQRTRDFPEVASVHEQ